MVTLTVTHKADLKLQCCEGRLTNMTKTVKYGGSLECSTNIHGLAEIRDGIDQIWISP